MTAFLVKGLVQKLNDWLTDRGFVVGGDDDLAGAIFFSLMNAATH